eukprot:scaffold6306_cov59-Phaeocystis_antarctica.AAC.1
MGGNILLKVPGWRCGTAGVALCHFRPPLGVNSFLPPFVGAAKPAESNFSWAHPQTLFLVARTFWPLRPPPHRTVFGFSSSWSLCKEGTLWPVDVPCSKLRGSKLDLVRFNHKPNCFVYEQTWLVVTYDCKFVSLCVHENAATVLGAIHPVAVERASSHAQGGNLANIFIPPRLTKAAVAARLQNTFADDSTAPMVNAQAEPVQPTTGFT